MDYKSKSIDSFKAKFKIFIFDYAKQNKLNEITLEVFNKYNVTKEIINEYTYAWQIRYKDKGGDRIKQIDDLIIDFENNNKELIKELQNDYILNTFPKIFPKEKFNKLIRTEQCHYCGITKEDINKLIEKKQLFKKQITRGWTFELDRKNPNEEYYEDNCVMSCYWCNNAKTDEFFENEFMKIGKVISEIWENRLK